MAKKTTSRRPMRREATPGARMRDEVRDHIIGVALGIIGLLSLVALISGGGSVLNWWRSLMIGMLGWGAILIPALFVVAAAVTWQRALARRLLLPGIGALLIVIALLGIAHDASGSGGAVGRAVGGAATGTLGAIGGLIVLVALLAVGVVVGANRTLSELARPAIDHRPQFAFRPGAALPGGTARRFEAELFEAEPEPVLRPDGRAVPAFAETALKVRINLPEERPGWKPPKVIAEQPVLGLPAAPAVPPGLEGLPSAMLAAEGVLHATADRTWTVPSMELLEAGDDAQHGGKGEIEKSARIIEETLAHFNILAKVVEATVGPVVTRYEIKPAPGVKLSRIEALNDDLSLALAARTLRIEAPVPGKSVVGIEVPNLAVGVVSLRDVAETTTFRDPRSKLMVALGRDVSGSPIVLDLAAMPHLLVAGQTGSGKSVSISSILCSLLLNSTPDDVRLLIGDLKRVDFSGFADIPHLIAPVMTDGDKILNALYWVTGEMDRRYRLFARASARNIAGYNEARVGPDRIPYIVFVIDELADLMLQAPIQVEKQITRVAQLARATGIHLVLGTQRPSVDVITGLIKANIPARIAFATASAVDSRTILDMTGAEKLLGRGDMLVLRPDLAKPIRAQGVFTSDKEIAKITRHWVDQSGTNYDRHNEVLEGEDKLVRRERGDSEIEDDRYDEAVDIVRRAGQASVSMLQRKMTVGFARAGRLIDIMEQEGVVGPSVGPGKMRLVYGTRPAAAADADER
ncbi:MAG TPA: DNA translocase FtsK 4TM domain-containing protein [Candidatus Limnocylindria bacterium]|nr:DNA translocase FtsK 4TM domain-containing protein [Candidatus Limnocylindria bacterium]